MAHRKKIDAFVGHLSIEVSSLINSRKFYEALTEALQLKSIYESKKTIGWGSKEFQIWIAMPEKPRVRRDPPTGEEVVVSDHVAICVAARECVNTVDDIMRKHGFDALFPPEGHPEFSKDYYSASYCDPDNYVIEVFYFTE